MDLGFEQASAVPPTKAVAIEPSLICYSASMFYASFDRIAQLVKDHISTAISFLNLKY